MKKDDGLTKQIIALEVIQTIIRHSDDNYILRIALTQKLKDLLGCKLVVFINYNIFSPSETIVSVEISQSNINRDLLDRDLNKIAPELKKIDNCISIEGFHKELPSFSEFNKALIIPIKNNDTNVGTIILFDIIQLYDHDIIQQALESAIPYISIVLYNSISYHQMENIINARTIELKHAIEKVNESSRSKSMFLANMSHEMRTPLNGILGFVDLLLLVEEDPGKVDYLSKIKRASRSLLHLISEVLDFSKLEFESIELYERPFDLMQAIEDIISLHQERAHSKGIELRIQSKGFPYHNVVGDVERFNQVLSNLISNAIKFTERGSVTVNIESHIEDVIVDNELIDQRLKLNCDVIDTGIGIRKENLKKVFEVFTQEDVSTTRKYGGTGLGLSISKRLIELMDGAIKVESVLGEGSIFSFHVYFDLSSDYSSKNEPSDIDKVHPILISHPRVAKDLNILVAEDNDLNANLIGEILKMKDITPDFANNGEEAVKLTKSKDYHIILMDCQMPEMDGFTATKTIRKTSASEKRPYIIALTAAVSEEDKQKCFDAGMDDYLTKPIDLNSIIERIEGFIKKNLT